MRVNLSHLDTFDSIIPYSSHVEDAVIMTTNQDFVSTWKLEGISSECESIINLDINNMMTHNFLKSFSSLNVTFYTHVVRSKHTDSFNVKTNNYFSDRINKFYYENMEQEAFRKNSIFFTMVYSPYNLIERSTYNGATPELQKEKIVDILKTVKEFTQNIDAFLKRFAGQKLTTYVNDHDIVFSKQLEFYNFLISGIWKKIPVTSTPIYNIFGVDDIYFANQNGQINSTGEKRFFRAIEILEFPESSNSLSISSLLISDCDFVLTQSFSCIQKVKSLGFIKNVINKLRATVDDAISQRDDLIDAKDQLAGNDIFFGNYHFSLLVYGESIDETIQNTNKQMSILSDIGFLPRAAEYSLYAYFFSQLPGVFDLRPRLGPITGKHFIDLASFHNFESGKRDKNCWGEALAILRTPNKQAYYLNLHESKLHKDEFGEKNVASTSVIGTTGSGKTMLLSFLVNMLQKYGMAESFNKNAKNKKLTTVFLDKDRGAELNIRALGGRYCNFAYGEPTGWNPFCLPATHENIAFVKDLIHLLCTMNGSSLSTRQEYEINRSVNSVMSLPLVKRAYGISRVIEALNQSSDKEESVDSLALRLKKWSKGGEYGWLFDNESDNFSIEECANFGFDGTSFLERESIRAPISFYILHRISEILDGRRVVIFIDEFWKWLSDDVFAKFAEDKLKTIRKLNGILIYATQDPSDMLKSSYARSLVGLCETQIFLSNNKATKSDYIEGFKLTEEEYSVIKNLDQSSRCFLVKKSSLHGNNQKFSVVAKLDLSSLGANAKILSSSADNLKIFEEIYKETQDPKVWVDEFLKVAV